MSHCHTQPSRKGGASPHLSSVWWIHYVPGPCLCDAGTMRASVCDAQLLVQLLLNHAATAWLQCMSLFSRSNGVLARYKAKPASVSIVQQPGERVPTSGHHRRQTPTPHGAALIWTVLFSLAVSTV